MINIFSKTVTGKWAFGTRRKLGQATQPLLPEKFGFSRAPPSAGEFLLARPVSAQMELLPENLPWTLGSPPSWYPRVPAISIFGSQFHGDGTMSSVFNAISVTPGLWHNSF